MDRLAFYEQRAPLRARECARAYNELVRGHYAFLVPPGLRVLELGCGLGDLLAEVRPAYGVGVDFSPAMIDRARQRHPELGFQVADTSEFTTTETFDYILLSDLVNDLPDVQALLNNVRQYSQPQTRLVLNFFSNVWRPMLRAGEWMGAKSPTPPQNWLATTDMKNLLHLAGWEVIKTEPRILWPLRTFLVASYLNRWLAPLLPFLCLTVYLIARPRPQPSPDRHFSCSVVVPASNEAGNIEAVVRRIPEMGRGTEIVFIEGHSQDNTWTEIQQVAARHPGRNIKILKQKSKGKAGAVREAFAAASGDVLFILDADLTVTP